MPQDCFDVLQKKNCVGAKCSTTKGKEVTVKLPQPIKRKQNDELRKGCFKLKLLQQIRVHEAVISVCGPVIL